MLVIKLNKGGKGKGEQRSEKKGKGKEYQRGRKKTRKEESG